MSPRLYRNGCGVSFMRSSVSPEGSLSDGRATTQDGQTSDRGGFGSNRGDHDPLRRFFCPDWVRSPADYLPRHRYWLHALLLLLTLISTTVVGAGMARSFELNQPVDVLGDLDGYARILQDPLFLMAGLPFSLTLLAILLAHEFGHYIAAR